jgi:hypothetical protein
MSRLRQEVGQEWPTYVCPQSAVGRAFLPDPLPLIATESGGDQG